MLLFFYDKATLVMHTAQYGIVLALSLIPYRSNFSQALIMWDGSYCNSLKGTSLYLIYQDVSQQGTIGRCKNSSPYGTFRDLIGPGPNARAMCHALDPWMMKRGKGFT